MACPILRRYFTQGPLQSLLDDIRVHRIPVDFLDLFDSARLPFYDGVHRSVTCLSLADGMQSKTGCLVVELLDYRPQRGKEQGKPERTRVVLHPTPETHWADVCLLNQKTDNKWSDKDALEVEARILVRFVIHPVRMTFIVST